MNENEEVKEFELFSTGSQILNCVLGGGWPSGSTINIQGDSSSGKTLLVLEAATNHLLKWPDSKIWVTEKEPSFAAEYFETLGFPMDKMEFWDDVQTIEDWFEHMQAVSADFEDNHGLIILDSLDSLSDEDEMERDIRKGAYGATKARKASEILRRSAADLEKKNITTMVVSQLRDAINSPIPMKVRSGGRAVEYYCGIVLRLTTKNKLKRTVKGVERETGVEVEAKCNKSKVSKPFRKCTLSVMFEYGIDDLASNLGFLKSVSKFDGLEKISPIGKVAASDITAFVKEAMALPKEALIAKRAEVAEVTKQVWNEVEAGFAVEAKKY